MLYRLSTATNRAPAPPEVYEDALDAMRDVLDAPRASVLTFDEGGVMRFRASRGLSMGRSLAQHAMQDANRRTCWPTPPATPRPAAGWSGCSSCSTRVGATSPAPRAALASASPSCAAWWSCTAGGWAASEGPGTGSQFTLMLPALADAVAEDGSVAHRALTPPDNRRVLVVDDHVDPSAMLAAMLESWGHSIAVEHDALAVLERVRELRPDVVLIDIGLPPTASGRSPPGSFATWPSRSLRRSCAASSRPATSERAPP